MLISLTVETSGRGPHALESLTAHKITTFRCKYLATMATGDDDDNDKDGATTVTATAMATATVTAMATATATETAKAMAMAMAMAMATARRAMGYNDDGGGR